MRARLAGSFGCGVGHVDHRDEPHRAGRVLADRVLEHPRGDDLGVVDADEHLAAARPAGRSRSRARGRSSSISRNCASKLGSPLPSAGDPVEAVRVVGPAVDAERAHDLDAHLAEDVHRGLGAEVAQPHDRRVADRRPGGGVVPDEPALLVELAQHRELVEEVLQPAVGGPEADVRVARHQQDAAVLREPVGDRADDVHVDDVGHVDAHLAGHVVEADEVEVARAGTPRAGRRSGPSRASATGESSAAAAPDPLSELKHSSAK